LKPRGGAKTGLAYDTSGLACRYIRTGEGLSAPITLQDITTIGTYQAPSSNAHIRFREVDATYLPGVYELHLHNDWVAGTSAKRGLRIMLCGASGMVDTLVELGLTGLPVDEGEVILADAAHGGTSATLTLRKLTVAATSSDHAIEVSGYDATAAVRIASGDSVGAVGVDIGAFGDGSYGLFVAAAGENAQAVYIEGTSPGKGVYITGGVAVDIEASDASGQGLRIRGGATGHGVELVGGVDLGRRAAVDGDQRRRNSRRRDRGHYGKRQRLGRQRNRERGWKRRRQRRG
jgi:hypothetical protein